MYVQDMYSLFAGRQSGYFPRILVGGSLLSQQALSVL